jgi:TPR repeat protein
MRNLIVKITSAKIIFATCLFVVATSPVLANPLEQGKQAYSRGDYAQAKRYWLPLARQNNADAMFNLGILTKNGLGEKKDPKAAMLWFRKSAYYGNADAAYNLGVMYVSGEAGFPSKKDAIHWWKQAAEKGHHESQYNYAVMLALGSGVARDTQAAMDWWKLSAQQGDVNAINALVEVYELGRFEQPKNQQKAKYWKQFLK